MKQTTIIITFLLGIFLFGTNTTCLAQDVQPETTHGAGYINKNIDGYWGEKNRAHLSAAIHLTEPMLNGTQIIALKCAIGATEKVIDCKFFIKKSLDREENLYEQEFTPTYGWNYIPLDFAFSLSGLNDLYIGYELTTSGTCIGYEQTNQNQPEADYIRKNFGEWEHLSKYTGGALCIVPVLTGGDYSAYPSHSIDLINETMPKIVKANAPFSLKGLLLNTGSNTLKNYEVAYSVDNGKEERQLFETNLWNEQITPFELSLNIPEGKHQVNVRIERLNGTEGESSFTRTYNVEGLQKAFPHTLLIEYFTAQGCGNCPDAKAILDRAMYESKDKISLITHHAGYSPDIFTIKESESIATQFGITEAPNMTINRSKIHLNGKEQLFFHPAYIKSQLLNERIIDASPVGVQIENSYFEGDSILQVKVTVEKDASFKANANLHVYLCENEYYAYQGSPSGGYGSYNHSHFPRKILSPLEGDILTYDENGNCTKNYTYKIPAEYQKTKANPKNMELTAFIATYQASNSDFTVYNTTTQPLKAVQGSGIESVETPASPIIPIRIENDCIILSDCCISATIYNLTGSVVARLSKEEILRLPHGIYLLRATTPSGIITQKISLH